MLMDNKINEREDVLMDGSMDGYMVNGYIGGYKV